MPWRKLEVNAQCLTEADTGPFGIANWLAHARTCDGIRFRIANGNCRVAEVAGGGRDAVRAHFQGADLPLLFLWDSHCN
jgi:hypothetical protein